MDDVKLREIGFDLIRRFVRRQAENGSAVKMRPNQFVEGYKAAMGDVEGIIGSIEVQMLSTAPADGETAKFPTMNE